MFTTPIFSKLGLAAAIIAVGSFATVDLAEAKRGDGKRDRAGTKQTSKKRVKKTVVTRAAPVTQVRRKKKNKGLKKFARTLGAVAVAVAQSQRNQYGYRNDYIAPRKMHNDRFRNRDSGRFCVAVAKTRRGYGRRIDGIRAKAHGRRACRKAMNRCENRLYDRRQSRGRNPRAACVIARRG